MPDDMLHEVSITTYDSNRLEELFQEISDIEKAYPYSMDTETAEISVRLNLEDEYSERVREDWYQNRIDRRIGRLLDTLEAMNWNHFDVEEMTKVVEAIRLLEEVEDSYSPGERVMKQCSCSEDGACDFCGGRAVRKWKVDSTVEGSDE